MTHRFVLMGNDYYDLANGSLHGSAIGECEGRKIYSAETLLGELEMKDEPVMIFPIKYDTDILKKAKWYP